MSTQFNEAIEAVDNMLHSAITHWQDQAYLYKKTVDTYLPVLDELIKTWDKVNVDQPIPANGGMMMQLDSLIRELETIRYGVNK